MTIFRLAVMAIATTIAVVLPADAQPGGRPGGGGFEAMLQQIDTNGDGAISASEMDAAQADRFAALDADADGRVSEAEFLDAVKGRGRDPGRMADRMSRRFAQMDGDGDGTVTEAEFAEAGEARFARLDADGDGVVTADEIRETMRAFREQSGGSRSGGGL